MITAPGYTGATRRVTIDSRRHSVLLQPTGALAIELQPASEARLWLAREDRVDVTNLFSMVAETHDIDATGKIEVHDLDLGAAYLSVVVAPGSAPVRTSIQDLPRRLELPLDEGLAVTGTVLDERGDPIAGATVEALGRISALDNLSFSQRDLSAADGAFSITGLLPGEVRVRACSDGRACSELKLELDVEGGAQPLRFELAPGHDLVLSIEDQLGNPVGRVTVYFEDRVHHTDDRGRLEIKGVARGLSIPVKLFGNGFGTWEGSFNTDREKVVLRVPGGGVLEQQVLTARRFSPDEVTVSWQSFTAEGREGKFGGGDWDPERGVARATGLEAGTYELRVRLPGSATLVSERVEVTPGDEVVLPPVVPDRGFAISGRVLDATTLQPLPGAGVGCEPGSPQIFRKMTDVLDLPTVLTDADGVFLLEGLDPGACRAVVRTAGFATWRRDGVKPDDAGYDLGDIEMDAGMTVVGQVRDRMDRPITGAAVEITEAAAYAYFSETTVRTNHDGYFRAERVPVGRFRVTAKHGGQAARTTIEGGPLETLTADLILGGIRIEGEVWLGDTRASGGTVVLATQGSQARGVVVMFERVTADRQIFGIDAPPIQLSVSHDGRFSGAGLEPGRYYASYTPTGSGAAPVTQALDVPQVDTFQCVIQYSDASVEGFVVDADGLPVAGASVLASVGNGRQEATAFTDGEGRFSVHGLEPGPAVLTASHSGFAPSAPAEIELSDGRAEGPVVLELLPPDGAKIDLTLRTASGSVGGAPIYLVGPDTATGFTDGTGFASFTGIAAGAYRPCGFAYGGATGCGPDLRVGDGDQLQASLDLGRGGYVDVLFGAEKRLPRVTVMTSDGVDLSSMLFMASPPQPMAGGLRIGPLQADDYIISVASPAGPRQGQVSIHEDEATELDLR